MRAGRSVIKPVEKLSSLIYHMKIVRRIEPMANVKKRVIGRCSDRFHSGFFDKGGYMKIKNDEAIIQIRPV
jgi:hypothetical protein